MATPKSKPSLASALAHQVVVVNRCPARGDENVGAALPGVAYRFGGRIQPIGHDTQVNRPTAFSAAMVRMA
jgi:hypothetical protein